MTVSRWRLAGSLAVAALASAALASAAPAQAGVAHTVEPGETLWSIAAASNLTTRTLAAANGMSEGSAVVTGSTITVPSEGEGAAALAGGGTPAGAAPSGTATAQPAAGGGTAADSAPSTPPSSTPGRVDAAQIGHIAGHNGVPSSLAAAIAWQESGFDNGAVSSANARGVMQVMPGTWSWVQTYLAGRKLDPSSAQDNVHAGTLYLGRLLRDAGGDPATAVAGYYQGPASVRSIGMLPETRRYVANVLALRGRFGG